MEFVLFSKRAILIFKMEKQHLQKVHNRKIHNSGLATITLNQI